MGKAFGALRAGGTYADYPQRYSFLIDPQGIIQRTYDVNDVDGHARQVLADLAELQRAL